MELGHSETWVNLDTVIQKEVSQREKNKYCILVHICGIQPVSCLNLPPLVPGSLGISLHFV